ncbi:MAG: glutathione peroxidase [Tepidisphaeraceae bacterium]|jgi:glutathione peroxidase
MQTILTIAAVASLLSFACSAIAQDAATAAPTLHGFTVKDIDGKDVDLSRYKGKVVLVVNVASKCGYTPQYKQLQEVFDKYKDKGLVVLGFPANEFRQQEPGSNAEIKEFCTSKYNVTFDMFSKIVVKGEGIAPLYQWLTDKGGKFGGDIKWNFTKFLIGKDGRIVNRFEPAVKPDDAKAIEAIEAALK